MDKIQVEIIKKAIKLKISNKAELNRLKRQVLRKTHGQFPRDLDLLKTYRALLKQKKVKRNLILENLLMTRAVRTLSGIAAITVLTKPYACKGECIYCPQEKGMPKSYLKNEPAAARAYLTNFDPFLQVKTRLKSLDKTGHNTEKIELIILGGSFANYPKVYQRGFIKNCFDALNGKKTVNLKEAQKLNENTAHRLVGLSIEVRPDEINEANLIRWRNSGVTRIEIGVQTVFDSILKKCRRGHNTQKIILATQRLKDWGFKVVYHLMPNLPGSTPEMDFKIFKTIFQNSHFQPDQIKIYPLVVLKDAPLNKIWKNGNYIPYKEQILIKLLVKIKKIIPNYVRVIRLIRDIPKESILAGNKVTNLRQILQQKNATCHCIRCREAKSAPLGKIYFYNLKYQASYGIEHYLSFEDRDQKTLYAHLRLRLPSTESPFKDSAIIRELHTFGKVASLNSENQKDISQHKGLGKKLMRKAEAIAKDEGYQKMMVISGIGVRGYYEKLGYELGELGYMVKKLKIKNEKLKITI